MYLYNRQKRFKSLKVLKFRYDYILEAIIVKIC